MARFEDETFQGKTVLVDGNQYINCHFDQCHIVFGGYDPPVMQRCVYEYCSYGLEGRATLVADWLKHLMQAGGTDGLNLVLLAIGVDPKSLDRQP